MEGGRVCSQQQAVHVHFVALPEHMSPLGGLVNRVWNVHGLNPGLVKSKTEN